MTAPYRDIEDDLAVAEASNLWVDRRSQHAKVNNPLIKSLPGKLRRYAIRRLGGMIPPAGATAPLPPRSKRDLNLAKELFREAHRSFTAGDVVTALDKSEEALRLDPANVRAMAIKAEILAERGDFDEAHTVSNDMLRLEPQNISALKVVTAIGRSPGFDIDVVRAYSEEVRSAARYMLTTSQYLNFHSLFDEAEQCAAAGMLSLLAASKTGKDSLYQGLALERAYALEKAGKAQEALAVLNDLDGVGREDKTDAAKARCYMELGNFSQAAALLKLTEQGGADRVIVEAIPILYGMGEIGRAHKRYHLRGSSKALVSLLGAKSVTTQALKERKPRSLFLFGESGPGDEIRFSTMYGELTSHAEQVTITCEPRLHTLLARSYPDIDFVPVPRFRKELRRSAENREAISDRGLRQFATEEALDRARSADVAGSVMDLLAEFRDERSKFASPSLLTPDISRAAQIRDDLRKRSSKRLVGISWRSMLMSSARERHYFPVGDLSPLVTIPNTTFVVLQAGVQPAEIETLERLLPSILVHDGVDLIDDFESQAALIENLDLVISPFTSMGELSGALGKPTILLSNSHQTTWRRDSSGNDIWYPATKIVGSETIGHRRATVAEAAELAQAILASTSTVTQ